MKIFISLTTLLYYGMKLNRKNKERKRRKERRFTKI